MVGMLIHFPQWAYEDGLIYTSSTHHNNTFPIKRARNEGPKRWEYSVADAQNGGKWPPSFKLFP